MGEINTDLPIEKVIINDIEVPVAVPSGYANVGDTTATADTVMEGKEFYNAQGEKTVGTYVDRLQERINETNNCFCLFYQYIGKNPNIAKGLNTSNVTNMQNMFYQCNVLTDLDISSIDTSNVNNMSYMFGYCEKLTNLDLSHFNTSKVTSMSNMFYYCKKLESITFGENFDTNDLVYMSSMFYNCSELKSIDLSSFNTRSVVHMQEMFYLCSNLTNIDLSSFNTSNVNNMQSMFRDCKKLISLDISHFDMTKVTTTNNMFNNCTALTNVILPSTIKEMDTGFFLGCSSLTEFTVLAETPPTLANTTNCINSATTSIYVPDASVDAYKGATNWSTYADRIKPLSSKGV